jgi:hypothetical protein
MNLFCDSWLFIQAFAVDEEVETGERSTAEQREEIA